MNLTAKMAIINHPKNNLQIFTKTFKERPSKDIKVRLQGDKTNNSINNPGCRGFDPILNEASCCHHSAKFSAIHRTLIHMRRDVNNNIPIPQEI
jgi:hypothetical protein